jgi:glycosyltransferase involved in cell wall biosynthesis
MKTIEFKTKIKNNQIPIPPCLQSVLEQNPDVDFRVIVFIDDSDAKSEHLIKQATAEHFLNGYSDSDSIYDNY